MKYFKLLLVLCLSFAFGYNTVLGEENNPKTVIEENVLIDYDIVGSSIVAGTNVSITNDIDGAALIFGETINLNSNIEYSAIFGSDITISGKIKDAIIFGSSILLNESSNIERDVIIYGTTVSISGLINRDITIYADEVKIDSVQVAGDIYINAKEIIITENSNIMGILSHNDDAIIEIADSATVKETITFDNEVEDETIIDKIISYAMTLIGFLVVFAVILFISPKLINRISKEKDRIVKNMGYGIITLLLVPIISLVLIFTEVGLPLGLITLSIYVILIYTSIIVTGYLLGHLINKKVLKKKITPYLEGILGITIVFILVSIPYVGSALYFINLIISLGIITNLILNKRKA